MRAGTLRHRIQIQARAEAQDSYGGVEAADSEDGHTWTTEATRWACVEPLVGREYHSANAEGSKATHWIRMRHFEGLTPAHRLKWRGRYFNIQSIQNIDEIGRETRILCEEILT